MSRTKPVAACGLQDSLDRSHFADEEVMSPTDRQVFSPEEVARMLGVHANTVYSMLKAGELPALKAGRKWLISRRRFAAWLDGEQPE